MYLKMKSKVTYWQNARVEETGKETLKHTEPVIKVYGIEIPRDQHFALTKNDCTTKNTRMKIIFTSVKIVFAKFVVP